MGGSSLHFFKGGEGNIEKLKVTKNCKKKIVYPSK